MVYGIEMCMCRLWAVRKEEICPISNRVLDRMTDWGSLLSNLCLLTTRETIYNCVLFPFLFLSSSLVLFSWYDRILNIRIGKKQTEKRSPLSLSCTIHFSFLSFLLSLRSTFRMHVPVVWQQKSYFNNTFSFLFLLLLFPYNYSWHCFNLTATCSLSLSLSTLMSPYVNTRVFSLSPEKMSCSQWVIKDRKRELIGFIFYYYGYL